jgi:hypothetical protein
MARKTVDGRTIKERRPELSGGRKMRPDKDAEL